MFVKEYDDRRQAFGSLLRDNNLTGIGVEVGVEYGYFSDILLEESNLALLVSVDNWLKNEAIMYEAASRLVHHGKRSALLRADSAVAATIFPDNSLDFIYLDTYHAYDDISRDIKAWWPKLRPGGLFAGHDYVPDYTDPSDGSYYKYGVIEAVGELAEKEGLEVKTVCEFPSWLIWKPAG